MLVSAIKTHLEPLGVHITTGAPYLVSREKDSTAPVGGFFTHIRFPFELLSKDAIAKRERETYGLIFSLAKFCSKEE